MNLHDEDEQAPDYFQAVENDIKELEGFKEQVYLDQKKNPTVGYGFNLKDKGTKDLIRRYGIDPEALITGQAKLDRETAERIFKERKKELDQILNNSLKNQYGDVELEERTLATLQGLNYNSPKLVGPKIREAALRGDEMGIAREIALKSNLTKDPGIQYRRLRETETFLGPEKYQKFISSLSDEEKMQIGQLLSQIQNEHTKKQAFERYPDFQQKMPAQSNFGPKMKKLLE